MGSTAPLILRIITGTVMASHGFVKFMAGPSEVYGVFFESSGILFPVFIAWSVTLIELVGGFFLISGLFTRVTSLLFSSIMLGAIFFVTINLRFLSSSLGPGMDLNLVILAASLALVFSGPGRYSLDHFLRIDILQHTFDFTLSERLKH